MRPPVPVVGGSRPAQKQNNAIKVRQLTSLQRKGFYGLLLRPAQAITTDVSILGQSMASIQEECANRNIDCLFHFSPVEHLDSILKHGLLVPSACATRGTGMKPNDAVRHDRQDAICLSVEWPNYKLFYSFRQRDSSRQWALIAIQHRVLWEKRVCFNTTNAADNSMSVQSFAARQGLARFREMFGDCCGKVRSVLNLTDHLTTNPQAEVLCLDTIEPAYFDGVLFSDNATYNTYKSKYPDIAFMHNTNYFSYRTDWSHWKNG